MSESNYNDSTIIDVKKEVLFSERNKVGRIFSFNMDNIEITNNFHIYLIDARGAKSKYEILLRIDKLLENNYVKEKETIQYPVMFNDMIEFIKEDERESIVNHTPVINNMYRTNFITGKRTVESDIMKGYFHNISWIGIILSSYIHNKGVIPGVMEYEFKTIKEFMTAYIPQEEKKIIDKFNLIRDDGDNTEIKQYLSIVKLVRPEVYEKLSIFDINYNENKPMSNDIADYLNDMESFKKLLESEEEKNKE